MRNYMAISQDEMKLASVLVVDDEPVNVKLLTKYLHMHGFENVTSTMDSREVIPLCRQQDFNLILLDLNMPHMDGFEVMDLLLGDEEYVAPPILVLTAQSAQEFRLRALQAGARDYVTKPFDHFELLARVKNLLEISLSQKALLVQNEELEERVSLRTEELHETRLEVVRRLGRAAEYRDNETGMHIIRMSKISELLGRAAGMDANECDLLLNASPMHDIGKLAIPDHILLKPGKFEPEEWEIMKTHAQLGADLLDGSDTDLMCMARDIAATHHEKWDGSGYPNGLAGEEIPLVGRVVALADVFDALTSERPYKKAWSVEDAVNLIKEQSGKHFEPRLVEHFLALLPEVTQIKDKYAESFES